MEKLIVERDQKIRIKTREMHCAGEPVRIIESGFPAIPREAGSSFEYRLEYVKNNLDEYRCLLMLEPRGHNEMYGALLLAGEEEQHQQEIEDFDLKEQKKKKQKKTAAAIHPVIFMHHTGYSPMCGHATLALAKYFGQKQRLSSLEPHHPPSSPSTSCSSSSTSSSGDLNQPKEIEVRLRVPCGLVKCWYIYQGPEKTWSRFLSVESFVEAQDVKVLLPSVGINLKVDIAFGGAYYAILNAALVGVLLGKTSCKKIAEFGKEIEGVLNGTYKITHPSIARIGYIYGVIFTDDTKSQASSSSNNDQSLKSSVHCVAFAGGQIDRSPCGSGVTARMALLYKKRLVQLNESVEFVSAVNGETFIAKVDQEKEWFGKQCSIIEVKGKAYYTGKCEFSSEPGDDLAFGFDVK